MATITTPEFTLKCVQCVFRRDIHFTTNTKYEIRRYN